MTLAQVPGSRTGSSKYFFSFILLFSLFPLHHCHPLNSSSKLLASTVAQEHISFFVGYPVLQQLLAVTDVYCLYDLVSQQFNEIHQTNLMQRKLLPNIFCLFWWWLIKQKIFKSETTSRAVLVGQFYYHEVISVNWDCLPLSALSLDISKWTGCAEKREGQLSVLDKSRTCRLMLS